ncbi:carbohydrate-binding module family 20 domain-containing protein [Candidatus Finniella inopinata]|nr:carbohydrate-binding module family 20 domain-containing protein [Candidatus Finniella inopinata]
MQYAPALLNTWNSAYQPYIMILNDQNLTQQPTTQSKPTALPVAPYAPYYPRPFNEPSYGGYQCGFWKYNAPWESPAVFDSANCILVNGVVPALKASGPASTSIANTLSDLTSYGVSIPDSTSTAQNSKKNITVGYMPQSRLYGGITDLTTFIQAAKNVTPSVGVIVDVVFAHVTFDMQDATNKAVLHPMKIAGLNVAQDFKTFPDGFFKSQSSWEGFGPQLNLGNSYVQDMIVGYLRILRDIGVAGIRIDNSKATSPSNWQSIFQKAKNKGITFDRGYGEAYDYSLSTVTPYAQVTPMEDFILQNSLAKSCIANSNNGSIGKLIMPAALGNAQSGATFSVNHDMFPNIGGSRNGFYNSGMHTYDSLGMVHNANGGTDPKQTLPGNPSICIICAEERTNPAFIINSQLANAYLLAKRDGSPLIMRFEDEVGSQPVSAVSPYTKQKIQVATGDFADIIKNALAFRKAMDDKNAQYEYMVKLDDNTLLIARQFGFAVINVGPNNRSITSNDLKKDSNVNIPNGVYKDEAGASYTKSSSSFSATAYSRNVKYFTYDSFTTVFSLRTTKSNVYLVGGATELGNWNTANAIPMSGSSALSMSVKFNTPYASVPYKYIQKNGAAITWYPGNDLTIPTGAATTNDTW